MSMMYSDNGTNFVGSSNLLQGLNWKKISQDSSSKGIEWNFNPPSAAWWGEWWERLVRSVKELLRRVLGRACLGYQEMTTLLCECEEIIHSRPLTHITEDSTSLAPLTPAMFLQDISEYGVPDLDRIDTESLERRLKY